MEKGRSFFAVPIIALGTLSGPTILAQLSSFLSINLSGIFFAVIGGVVGGLWGAMLGRAARAVAGLTMGLVVGAMTGAVVAFGASSFFWYWGLVFRWTQWPAREDLSILALTGVYGAVVGGAVAGLLGSMRIVPRLRTTSF